MTQLNIPIEQEYISGQYRWFTYAPIITGLRLICLEDCETGTIMTTTVANPERRTAAHRAWAGARQSRAAGMPWDILREMGEKGIDPDQKIEETFRSYGHASVGDMARLSIDMGQVPMHLCLALFNESSLNSGQEKSTRYQPRFGKAILHQLRHYLPADLPMEEITSLEEEYQSLGTHALRLFARHREILMHAFADYYRPGSHAAHKSALTSRVLDCARSFLLFGQSSGMSFETSARDWSRILAELKASPIPYYHRIAHQIERLLAPTPDEEQALSYRAEAPGLIRHTEPLATTNQNLEALREYVLQETDLLAVVPIQWDAPQCVEQQVHFIALATAADRLVAQYLLLLWPGLERATLLSWVYTRDETTKCHISKIIFAGHNNYTELPVFARTTTTTLAVESFLGEVRDFNRHRAWGRFIPMPLVFGPRITLDTIRQILARGFGLPLYLTEVTDFAEQRDAFKQNLKGYYWQLQSFIDRVERQYGADFDYSFVVNLLPLAHQVDLWMHGDPKQALYMTSQRVRPGGHINYRVLAYEANQLLADADPYMSAMRQEERPDPCSRDEFFDRS